MTDPTIKPQKIDILDLPPEARTFVEENYPNRVSFYRYANRPSPGFRTPEKFKTFWADGNYCYGFYDVQPPAQKPKTPAKPKKKAGTKTK